MITQYIVGVDLTQDRYDEILTALVEWFKEYRPGVEAEPAAKYALDCCMAGVVLKDGKTPWITLAKSTLQARIKAATRFDINTMSPLKKEKGTGRKKEAKTLVGNMMKSDRTYAYKRAKPASTVEFGDNPLSLYTSLELKRRAALLEAYLTEFPQLDNVASRPKLDMMLDLILLLDRVRIRIGKNDGRQAAETEDQLTKLTKQLVDLEKALNIHADQLAKQQKEKEGGSIGEAVRRFEESVPLELRERWFAEELIMLYQMYHQRSPRQNMGGHQLDDIALFGATRCRTCSCSKCGERNFAGLSVEEIERYLIDVGAMSPIEVYKSDRAAREANANSEGVDETGSGDNEDTATGGSSV